jgi:hypothetical protein
MRPCHETRMRVSSGGACAAGTPCRMRHGAWARMRAQVPTPQRSAPVQSHDPSQRSRPARECAIRSTPRPRTPRPRPRAKVSLQCDP